MRARMLKTLTVLLAAALLPAAAAAASPEDPFVTFRELATADVLEPGQRIWITFEAVIGEPYEKRKVKYVEMSSAIIVVEIDPIPTGTDLRVTSSKVPRAEGGWPEGTVHHLEIPEARVVSINVGGDSLRNGTLIGAGVGAGLLGGLGIAMVTMSHEEEDPAAAVAAVAYGAALGAGIGLGIDALRTDSDGGTVYLTPGHADLSRVTYSAAPVFSRSRTGALFTIRW